jgi:hypothetical protein
LSVRYPCELIHPMRKAAMLSTQAVFLLAATMFGGVAHAEPGSSVPNLNVKAASRALALVPEARMIDLSAGYTLAQNAGPSPEGQVPGPNAAPAQDSSRPSAGTQPIQPVPGAMPDSDDVPSTISEKNARDDKLPLAAFRLKHLTDEQRQAIYRSVTANVQKNQATSIGTPVDVGTVLPRNLPLSPLPAEVTNRIPEVKDLQFGFSGDKLVLADPLYHQVLAVIPP